MMDKHNTGITITSESGEKFLLYKEEAADKIWWAVRLDQNGEPIEEFGPMYFSLDGKKVYNYWPDYPNHMTEAEIALFNQASPYWAEFRGYGK